MTCASRAAAESTSSRAARVALAALAFGLGACLDNKGADETASAARTVFIAQKSDFANYSDWMTFDVPDSHSGMTGTTTVYLNDLPKPDAGEFPLGTIVVKTTKPQGSGNMSIFAMAKRGAGFNPKGAMGWEYFELALGKSDEQPFWLWRGEKPPTGEKYLMLLSQNDIAPQDGEDDCNSCHAYADDVKDGTFGDLAKLLK